MKRSLLLTVLLVSLLGLQGNAYAQIFSAVSPSGHTLYYKVINPSSRWVELSNPNNTDGIWTDAWDNYSAPYGNVVVPQTVTFNNITWTVRRIGRSAFASCPTVKRVTLPEGIDSIKAYAFFGTEIDSVNIPSSVVYIGSSNFQSSRLHHVTLPVGLLYIDPWEQCGDSILDFTIPDGNPYYRTIDGCLIRTENGFSNLVSFPKGRINGTMEIPEGVNRISWEIMDYVYSTNIHRLVLPSTITRIGLNWFGFNQVDTIVCRSVTPPQLLFDGVDQQYIRPIRLEVPCGSQLLYNSSIWVLIAGSYGTVTTYLPLGNQSQTIEYGESYPWGNRVLTERGVYEDTVQSVLEGCDSMHRVLTLNVVRRSSVDVTIAEGGNYRGHTLAGVYEDTIPTANYDSIVRSRISMNVNRPLDNCMVQLGGNMASYYYNGMVIGGNGASIEVPPAESRQVFMNKALTFDFDFVSNGENLIPNGDFEQGNTGFTTEYNYDATTSNAASSYGIYNVRQDFGVNGSYGMGFDASQNPILLYGTTVPNIGGCVYRLTFMARTENTPPHFVVKVNGEQIDDIDYGPENQDWNTYEHYFYADGSNIDLQIFNVNLATESGVDFYMDNISLEYMPVDPNDIDTITITNTHGMVRNTVDVTINEGGSYRGHTLAGVYQDTIIGANTDSIVRSRVSMTINRPMDNCTVQLGGNVSGYCYTDGMDRPVMASEGLSTQVAPMETKQVLYGLVPGVNLLENGDFEQGNTGFSNDYTYVECGQPFCGYAWYNIMQGYGVDGSYGMAVDGAGSDHDLLRYEITLPNNANSTYKFSYMVMNSRYWNDENPPYIAIKVNGVQVGDTDYVPLEETWVTYEHTFTTDGGNIVIQLQDLNSDSYGNNFYVDNVRLESISVDAADIDTITVTNTHGMVYNTVDVTIAEGGSYRGHTLAGVYQDTVIGTNADSIVRSRISMTVNRPMDNCTVQLGGNVSGTYVNGEEYYCTGTNAQVQVLPAESSQLLFTTAMFGVNLIENGDFEQSDSYPYPGDYITADWDGSPYRTYSVRGDDGIGGNRCLYLDGSTQSNQAFFRHTITTREGDLYRFSYKARNWCSGDLPLLVFKVNGQQVDENDIVLNDCYTWTTFSHNFMATGGTTTIEIVDLNTMDGGNDWIVDDISLVCLTLDATDTITITNTHGMVIDTVDVTINEGGSYRSHTLAGVYCDTILGAATDSIVYARVSMNINHTFGEGYTTLSSNQEGHRWIGLDDDIASHNATAQVMVNPAESHRYLFAMIADNSNLLPNGDFEQGYVYFNSEYPVSESSIPFLNSYYYTICDTCGRTGKGMAVKGAREGRKNVYDSQYVPIVAGHTYSLNYWANSHENNPAILDFEYYNSATGEWTHLPDTNYLSEAVNQWKHFEVVFSPTMNGDMFFRIRNINYSDDGNEFFLDDISLVDLTVDTTASSDTIRVTNVHGMVYNTVDVTIAEGGSYRGHTLAGVYQDTIIGANADSIVRSRISMNVNRPMDNCTVQLGGNHAGYYQNEGFSHPMASTETITVTVPPSVTEQIVFNDMFSGMNLLVNGDFEQGDMGFSSGYNDCNCTVNAVSTGCGNYDVWHGAGVDGSYGFGADGASDGSVVFEQTVEVLAGQQMRFSYKASNAYLENPPYFAVLVNGVQIGNLDYPPMDLGVWTTFDHIFVPTTNLITIQLIDQEWDCQGNDFYLDDLVLEYMFVDNGSIDTFTITNTHGMVYDTVDVTIAEGGSYRGYTLAGVYQDTIIGANTDSIVRSRISMTVNRPMNNCTVQLGGNQGGVYMADDQAYYGDNMAVRVLPDESRQLAFAPYLLGSNMVVNGDFEQGDSYPYVGDYATDDGDGYGSRTYSIQEGNGVDGSRCMWFGGSSLPDQALFRITIPTISGYTYRFSYSALATIYSMPYFAVKVNGQQIDNNDIVPQENEWITFSHDIVATSDNTLVELIDLNTEWNGNDFLIDNIKLFCLTTAVTDTITITNTHGMVYDTVDVTIAEGGNFRGHTLAGVYQDTILGANTDSIVRSRVSMTVNRPMDNCTVQLGGNQGGTYFTENEYYPAGTEISVEPAESKTIQYTPDVLGDNLLAISDMEGEDATYISLYVGDYAANPGGVGTEEIYGWGGRGANGSTGLFFIGSTDTTKAFFRTSLSSNAGDRFSFRFMVTATGNNMDPNHRAILALKVNGELMYPIDSLGNCIEPTWGAFEHIIEATSDITTIELVNLHAFTGEGGDNQWFMDNFSLTKLFSTNSEAITITNTHGMVYDTVDVTIAEGDSYRGYTLAGVYQDTIIGANTDSIVRSRVSMTVNRPMDNCEVQLGGNLLGSYAVAGGESVQVLPGECVQVMFVKYDSPDVEFVGNGDNLIVNGDFEQGNTGFTTEYGYGSGCGGAGCGYGIYTIQQGYGVDGSIGMSADASENPILLWGTTVPTVPGNIYKFTFMARTENMPPPYFAVKVNGEQIGDIEYAPEDYNWHTFERLFFATSSSIDLQLYNLNPETGSGVDFYMDNFRLESMTTSDDNINTITITNTHGMVIDTIDVTIAEGGSYRSHTLAGVYCDIIIGATTDSIVYARVSMDINYTFGAGTASVTTNQEGRLWMGLDDEVLTTEPGFTVQLQPQEERRYVLTFIADNSNMQPNSNFESNSSNWSSDYAWSEIPFQGSHYINVCDTCGRSGNGLAVKGSELQNRFFYTGEWANLVEGHRYSFSYWAKSRTADNPAVLAVYVNDQQTEWMLPDTDYLNEAIGQWKHYEHTFTARRTYTSLMRIMDLNISNIGNEFFLDDVSLIDLTEAEDAHRDTITLHNTHGLHIATVDVTINEGESYIGHTLAGVYNDTLVMADYDSITHSRVSYIMNVSGAGFTSLENNVDGIWVDIDNNAFVEGDSIGVYSMESRHFGLLAPVSDTNLIANGDFEQGNTGFTSYFLHRPEPYDLGDGTYYIGGYRINEMDGNHYIYAFNYWEPRNGPLYVTTANVEPNTWYMISYRGVSNMLRGDVTVHPYGNDNTVKINDQLIGLDTLTYSGSVDMTQAETFTHYFYNNSETTVSIEINSNYGDIYDFAYDDITLTPLTIIDTVTITNRHQLVYNTVDITLNEGESYNGHTLAGVYNDTTFFADYDSITRSCISMVINSLDGYVQLSSNQHGWWVNLSADTVFLSSQVIANVPPMQSYQYMLDGQAATGNLLVNGDFEQGNTGFTSQYNYSEGCFGCGPGNYFVSSDHGVDNSGCLSVDGAEEYGKIAYEQAVTAVAGRIYRFRYMATTNGTDNSNPSWFEVLVNGTAIGNWDHISTNYPNWTPFEHVFIAPSNSLTIQIIDRNLEYSGNDFLLDNLELFVLGDDSTLFDTITITNIHQLVYDTVSANICQGESFTYDNTGFIETGTYDLPMLHSIDTTVYRTVVLDVHDIYYTQLQVDLCEGDSYTFGGDNLMQAGTYMDSLSSVWGCDSIVALDLTVHYVYNETTVDTACNSHYWNGEWRTVSGEYLYNHYAANGCPQVDTLRLTVNYSNSSYTEVEACDSMTWNGVTYTASEVVAYQTTNAAGCDSVATLNLTIKYSTSSESEAVVCDSYTWNGVTYTASGEPVYQTTNAVGCDSTATLYLTVNYSYQHTDTVNTCDNMLPFIYNEQPFSVAGNYTIELLSVEGCDSTIALTLNIGSTYSHTDELTICQSAMPYYYGPRTFVLEDTTGTYSIPFSTVDGCDSIVSLDLTVHESEVTEIYVVTVQATNNLVLWHKNAAVDHYNIYRESSTSGVYSLVAEIPYSDDPEWLDTESDARAHSYRYRMTSVDSCGTESDHGITHKTMHLTINKGQNNSWNLVWTEYEGTSYSTYQIYRGSSYYNLQMIGEIPSNNTTFTDNNVPYGNVYYQIVVLLSPSGAKDGNDGTIRSNVATNEDENNGIYDGIGVEANIYTVDGDIVVETMQGESLRVMDVTGRVLYKSVSTGSDLFTMPASGVYFVQVGTNQARRVVVVK